jgi:hypothetical protein
MRANARRSTGLSRSFNRAAVEQLAPMLSLIFAPVGHGKAMSKRPSAGGVPARPISEQIRRVYALPYSAINRSNS